MEFWSYCIRKLDEWFDDDDRWTTKEQAFEHAEETFAERCIENGEDDGADLYLIRYTRDEDGNTVILETIHTDVSASGRVGRSDAQEHGTWNKVGTGCR